MPLSKTSGTTASMTNQVEVSGLPHSIDIEKLKIRFGNQRRGGGTIEKVELFEEQHLAIITFQSIDDVKNVLKNSFTYDGCELRVKALSCEGKEIPKKTHKKTRKEKEDKKANDGRSVKTSVKATLIDVTKPKDFYIYYFEDSEISDGEFDENSLMQDGLHKQLFVTFHDEKDARAICRISHQDRDSNIIKIEMAAEEDFDYYDNLLSLHGFSFETEEQRNELKQFILDRTGRSVKRFTQYDEPRSILAKFSSTTKKDEISNIGWKCAGKFQGVHLITSPVYKNNIIKISGLGPDITKSSLQRYLTNKRSGGRPDIVRDIEHKERDAIVTLDSEEDVMNILHKKDHELENKKLKIEHYHPCLLPEVYQTCVSQDGQDVKPAGKTKSSTTRADKNVQQSDSDPESATETVKHTKTKKKKNTRKTLEKESASEEAADEDTDAVGEETKPKKVRGKNISTGQGDENLQDSKPKGRSQKESETQKKSFAKRKKDQGDTEEENQDELYEDAEENLDKAAKPEEVLLGHCEVVFLKKYGIEKELQETFKHIFVKIDLESDKVLLSGEKEDVTKAHIKIIETLSDNFGHTAITDLDSDQIKLLKKEGVQKKITDKLEQKNCNAVLGFESGIVVYYNKGLVTEDEIINTVRDQVNIEKMPIQTEMIAVFQSSVGQNFLSYVQSNFLAHVKLIADPPTRLLIIASSEQMYALQRKLDEFIKDYKCDTKEISFSSGEQTFVSRHLKEEFEKIRETSYSQGANLDQMPDKFILKGLEKGVENGCRALTALRNKIVKGNTSLKFDGIVEYITEGEGKAILKKIEQEHSCVITGLGYTASPAVERSEGSSVDLPSPRTTFGDLQSPIVVAELKRKECSIVLEQGDITCVEADALVNPMATSFKSETSLWKTLISRGGEQISQELTASMGSGEDIVQTSGGQFPNFTWIFHARCPKYSGDPEGNNELRSVLDQCLNKANDQGLRSIAIPAFGTGKAIGFPKIAASKIVIQALHNHIENEDTNLEKIVLCDMQADYLKELMDRCESIFDERPKSKGELDEQKYQASARTKRHSKGKPSSKKKDFKNIQVDVVAGEITSQSTDVIVSTIDKSLDMTKAKMSKAVLQNRGDAIQQELFSKGDRGITPGKFVQTSGGHSHKQEILHVCLSRWKYSGAEQLTDLICELIKEANRLKAGSLSIPSLGTGGLGYPKDVVANALFDAISKFAEENPTSHLKKVNIVVFPRDTEILQTCHSILREGNLGEKEVAHNNNPLADEGNGASGWWKWNPVGNLFNSGSTGNFHFGRVTLTVKVGDISKERCDTVVIAVSRNMDLSKSGSVCKSLLEKHGEELQDKLNSQVSDFSSNGVAVTDTHNQCIIHLNMKTFERGWDKGVAQALMEADRRNLKSLALPLLGAARRGANILQIKETIFKAVEKFGNSSTSLTDIRLLVYDQETLDAVLEKSETKTPAKSRGHRSTPDRNKNKTSKKVDLVIFSSSHTNVENARKKLEEDFKEKFNTECEADDDFKNLDQRQIKELELLGQKHQVSVSVNVKEGALTLQSFSYKGIMAVHKQLKKMCKEISESRFANIQIAAMWQYRSKHRWMDFPPSLNSQLEIEYQRKAGSCTVTDPRGRKYLVDFVKEEEFLLDQSNQKKGEPIKIRRFDQTKEEPLPKRWDHMDDGQKLKLVELRKGCHEFNKVEKYFQDGGVSKPVKKIERIQNKTLYQQYSVKKREIELQNPKGHENEKRLFHGTGSEFTAAINENGFSRNHKKVTAFGQGVYFAVKSSYSEAYATPDGSNGDKKMYQARVLVGQSTKSNSQQTFLPNKPGKNTPFDSGVDNETDPAMYVIFHDAQVYPEYLITF